jgi:hypothetical protein
VTTDEFLKFFEENFDLEQMLLDLFYGTYYIPIVLKEIWVPPMLPAGEPQ